MVKAATCGHSGKAATCGHSGKAATCGHSSGCEWLQVAAFYEIETPRPRVEGGHLRSLAATRQSGHLRPLAATCGHSSGCEWLQVAAFLKFKYRAECNPNERIHHNPLWTVYLSYQCLSPRNFQIGNLL